jgi:hypothetical protein
VVKLGAGTAQCPHCRPFLPPVPPCIAPTLHGSLSSRQCELCQFRCRCRCRRLINYTILYFVYLHLWLLQFELIQNELAANGSGVVRIREGSGIRMSEQIRDLLSANGVSRKKIARGHGVLLLIISPTSSVLSCCTAKRLTTS